MKPKNLLWVILIITLFSVVVDLPKTTLPIKIFSKKITIDFPLKLGLDLQGGTELILQADTSKLAPADRDQALASAQQVIERRVNAYGVSEARVQTSKIGEDRRILVDLPGLKDSSAAAELVGKTAKLDFRELVSTQSAKDATPSANFEETGLTGADLVKAGVQYGNGRTAKSGPEITLQFNDQGAKKFADITRRNVNKPLAIFLDDQPLEIATVQQEIDGGNAVITGQFTVAQAKLIATQLNAGALKVPVHIIDQRSVGPELGQESVNKSVVAGIIGLIILVSFMALYYGTFGLIADFALVIYALIVLAVFKTGLFVFPPITLTLAGIAGFVLSIGMAVDANILIFERMKEEIRWGKSRPIALDLGFKRAWSSIWASNVSSLITAVILYTIGTPLVKGFAITLAIGVLVSMFTAVVVTRTFLKLLVKA